MYSYQLPELLSAICAASPHKAEWLRTSYRSIQNNLLSVGLKIHCKDATLWEKLLSCMPSIVDDTRHNVYKHAQTPLTVVLPPVGSTKAAVMLIECLEEFIGQSIFASKNHIIQVCTPGKLSPENAAILSIAFYLSSDSIRKYRLGDFETTVSEDDVYRRGRRIALYDANGTFDREFRWPFTPGLTPQYYVPPWERFWMSLGIGRDTVNPALWLPFHRERTDIFTGSGSALDIANVNLVATLLVHHQYEELAGIWHECGGNFKSQVRELLKKHELLGILSAPWVHTPYTAVKREDDLFYGALSELVAYACEEVHRIEIAQSKEEKYESSGILYEMSSLVEKYHAIVKGGLR